jgi:nitrogen fixation protein FixH
MILVAIVAVLALGWFADMLGQFAPRSTFTNGETQQAGLYRVTLTFAPWQTRAGDASMVTAKIEDSDGRLVSDVTARLMLSMPTMDMTPVAMALAPSGNGVYTARTTFPMSGAWLVRVELAPLGAAPVHADFDVPVRQASA